MPLLKHGKITPDPWIAVADDAPLPSEDPVVVGLARWRAERAALARRPAPVGVRLKSHELAPEIGDDAGKLGLIALEFPSFRDGRAYSTARLLRERYRFTGELRAVGNVLRDQFLFMHRCGFDAFEIASADAGAWREAMAEIAIWYQPTADGRPVLPALRRLRRAAE
jgi:uncharacterized protein (DUF934 family)